MVAIFIIVAKLSYDCLYLISSIVEVIFMNNIDLQYVSVIFILKTINFVSSDIEDFFWKLHYSYKI